MTKYIENMKKKLKKSYDLAAQAAQKAQGRQKANYDLRTRGAVIEKDDRVLVKIVNPDSKGTLAQRQIMVGQHRRWAIYVGPTLCQPCVAMAGTSDYGLFDLTTVTFGQATLGDCWPNVGLR